MSILKYKWDLPGWWGNNDDMGWWLGDLSPIMWTQKEQWYDPTKYELRPREDYKKTLIENKQKEIDYLEEQKKKLEKELKELKT